MNLRVPSLGLLLGLLTACGNQISSRDPITGEVRRRIAQAVWPENLFDSAGRPERGFERRDFRPAFSDLRIRHVAAPASLPGVTLFVGTAR